MITDMNWNLRTFVRLFLVIGGTVILVDGVLSGETVGILIGIVAVILGTVGLVFEWRESTE